MRKLLRIEHLLLLAPVMFGMYAWFYFKGDADEGYYPGWITDLPEAMTNYALEWLWLLLPIYSLHLVLRWIGQRNEIVCLLHVVITLALCLTVVHNGGATTPEGHIPIYPPLAGIEAVMTFPHWALLVFWNTQLSFIIYLLLTCILAWRKPATS